MRNETDRQERRRTKNKDQTRLSAFIDFILDPFMLPLEPLPRSLKYSIGTIARTEREKRTCDDVTWNEQVAFIPSKRGESTTRVFSKSDCEVEDRLLDLARVQMMIHLWLVFQLTRAYHREHRLKNTLIVTLES